MAPVESSIQEPASNLAKPKPSFRNSTWKVGTLAYSGMGLLGLFGILLLGDFSWAMRERSVNPLAQWYLKHLEIPNFLFALLMSSIPSLMGLVLGPFISYKSDRHRGPRGRRIPFLIATTPIAAVGMIGLGITPHIATFVHQLLPHQSETTIALVCFALFWVVFEVATISASAVFGGLINDIVPMELMGRFCASFRAVSLIDGIIFNYWLFGKVETHYTVLLVCIGTFYGVCFYFVCTRVREGEYPPPPTTPVRHPVAGIASYFRECFGRPYYVCLFFFATISSLVFMPVNLFSIPFSKSVGMSTDYYGKCIALTFAISLVLAFPIGWLCDRFHPLRMCMLFLFLYFITTVWGALNSSDSTSFAVALVLHGVVSGSYFTSSSSLGHRLFPRSRYAQFGSAIGVIGAFGGMIGAPAVGSMIDSSGNYQHTFLAAAIISIVALGFAFVVNWHFIRLGGVKGYVSPE